MKSTIEIIDMHNRDFGKFDNFIAAKDAIRERGNKACGHAMMEEVSAGSMHYTVIYDAITRKWIFNRIV